MLVFGIVLVIWMMKIRYDKLQIPAGDNLHTYLCSFSPERNPVKFSLNVNDFRARAASTMP